MRRKLLIVDDSKFNRQVLINILQDEYVIVEAENGREALEIIEEQKKDIAAVLLDIVMPEMDGVTLLKILNEKKYLGEFPVLIVTSEQSVNLVAECFDYGISDFIRKPVNTDFVKQRVQKLVELYMQKNDYKERLERQTLTLRNQYKMLQQQSTELKKNNEKIIDVLGTVVEYRNMEGRNHVKRVKEFTRILGEHMMSDYPEYELTKEKINVIAAASVLHDVGKVMIPDAILLKPGKLTEEEYEYVKSHSIRGYDIINSIADSWDDEYVQYSCEIARSHHEKYDGSGYPDGLKGDDIPISAQLVSIADCYEALISESVYKSAIPYDEAYNMILQGECGVFSFKLLECFRKARKELEEYAENMDNAEAEELTE
ncbi:MAG: response regulator [Lachnospiraceae bacterium]|nr:response regulator [Lachnospiraceae bacterium]